MRRLYKFIVLCHISGTVSMLRINKTTLVLIQHTDHDIWYYTSMYSIVIDGSCITICMNYKKFSIRIIFVGDMVIQTNIEDIIEYDTDA